MEDAEKAINSLNGLRLQNKTIKVSITATGRRQSSDHSVGQKSLWPFLLSVFFSFFFSVLLSLGEIRSAFCDVCFLQPMHECVALDSQQS